MALLTELYDLWEKELQQHCYNQDWMKSGGLIRWNAVAGCETSKTSCLTGRPHLKDALGNHLKDRSFHLVHWLSIALFLGGGKTPFERRYGEPFKGPINNTFWRSIKTSSISPESFTGNLSWVCIDRGRNLERRHCDRGYRGIGKDGRIGSLRKKCWYHKREQNSRWYSKIVRKRLRIPRTHSETGIDRKERTSAENLNIPSRRRTNKIRWWRSGTENIHFDTGSPNSRRKSKRFFVRIRRPQDSLLDFGEARNDFWSISGNFIYRHHVEPRVKLYSPREESFPIPLKYIDVSRTTHTNLDVMRESRIGDYWNIDGPRDLSDSWTGFTQFSLLSEQPPEGHMWSGERRTKR